MTQTQPQPPIAGIDSSVAEPDIESHRLEMIEQLRQLPDSLVESIGGRLDAIFDTGPVEDKPSDEQERHRPFLLREFFKSRDIEENFMESLNQWQMTIAPRLKDNILSPLRVMQGHIPSDIMPLSEAPSATYRFHTVDRAIPSEAKQPNLDDLLTYQKLFFFPPSGKLLYLAEVSQELILKGLNPLSRSDFPLSIVAVTTRKFMENGNINPQLLTELFYWNRKGYIYRIPSRGEKYETPMDAGADTIHNYLVRLGYDITGSFHNRNTNQKLCLRSFPGISSPDEI